MSKIFNLFSYYIVKQTVYCEISSLSIFQRSSNNLKYLIKYNRRNSWVFSIFFWSQIHKINRIVINSCSCCLQIFAILRIAFNNPNPRDGNLFTTLRPIFEPLDKGLAHHVIQSYIDIFGFSAEQLNNLRCTLSRTQPPATLMTVFSWHSYRYFLNSSKSLNSYDVNTILWPCIDDFEKLYKNVVNFNIFIIKCMQIKIGNQGKWKKNNVI